MTTQAAVVDWRGDRTFYSGMALATAATVFAGFAAHRVDLHRRIGIGAALLAASMLVIGVAAAADALRRGATSLPEISR